MTVHFVTKTPGFYTIGCLVAVFLAKVRPVSAAFMICIFNAVHCILQGTGAKVYGVNGSGSSLFCPLQVFVVANIIWNVLMPGRIQVGFAKLSGTNGILPLPGRNKITTRHADSRQPGSTQCFNKISAEALRVCCRMLWIIHSAVYNSADWLHEGRKKSGRNLPDSKFWMNSNACFFRQFFLPLQ